MWKWTGASRPDFAIEPGPGQESVWDYPRPPALTRDGRLIEVRAGNTLIARSSSAVRVLETASPPTFYLPPEDVRTELLRPARGTSHCEWKGEARYFDLAIDGDERPGVAWCYPEPTAAFRPIAGWFCFYSGRVDCFVDGQAARPQSSEFYGGWITDDVVGPFKGDPGTRDW